jgi:hypothetical protein
MHHYVTNMWCEQYIECIINIWNLKNKSLHMGRNWHVVHISNHFLTLNSWCLHFLVYYKYLLNFQLGLFYKSGSWVTFAKFLHIKCYEFPLHMIFLCYSKGVLEHIFTNFHMALWPNSM